MCPHEYHALTPTFFTIIMYLHCIYMKEIALSVIEVSIYEEATQIS